MKAATIMGGTAALLLLAATVSLGSGETGWIAPWRVPAILAGGGEETERVVLWELRLPRTLLGLVAGAGLGVAGAIMQGFFRNPMAEPYVSGVSSGAAGAAVVVLTAGWEKLLPGGLMVSLAAFGGAVAAALVVYRIGMRQGAASPVVLILAGLAVAGVLQAVTMALLLRSEPYGMRSVLVWLLGSLAYRGWDHVAVAAFGFVPGITVAWFLARPLDLLVGGEESAAFLGLPVEGVKRLLMASACLLAATSVAACGIIAYVGLMAPHLARGMVGARHGSVIPQAALTGALLLTVSDLVARSAVPGQELPVGVVTGFLGALFLFGFLLLSRFPPETDS